VSTTAENLQELLPASAPSPPPNTLPQLPAPPGVTTQPPAAPTPGELMTTTAAGTAPRTAATSPVAANQTTAGQMRELLDRSSPYIQQAEGEAQRFAASRGLQNSSIAAQSGRQAAIAAALPIANADAGVYERRETDRLNVENTLGLAREQGDITSRLQGERHGQLLTEIGAQGTVQSRLQSEASVQRLLELARAGDIQSRQMLEQFGFNTTLSAQENLQRLQQLAAQGDLDARARLETFTQQTALQQREIANQQWMAQFDATTQAALQSVDIASRERMQREGFSQAQVLQAAQIASQERLAAQETETQRWLAQFDAAQRERLQGLDNDVRLEMQQLEIEAQERIADLNVSSAARSDATRMATAMELSYSNMLQSIQSNPDIPAAERQTYMDHAAAMRDSGLALVEQFFAIDLDW
jgi:hypothetical protein